jgi:hypothetical protein
MSDRGNRRILRSPGLPAAVACALAAGLGGCSTLRMPDFGLLGSSQTSCTSSEWPTKVYGSTQRSDYQSEPVYSEPAAVAQTTPEVEVEAEPLPPPPPKAPATEPPHNDAAQIAEPVAPSPAVPEAPVAPVVPEPQAPVAPQPPAAPPRQPPSPEVEAVCGAADVSCQDQLTDLLADPLHKWIREGAATRKERTSVRILAYRVLAPVLACEDLRAGVKEAEATAAGPNAAHGAGTEAAGAANGKGLEWEQLLGRAVKLELKAEILKRC